MKRNIFNFQIICYILLLFFAVNTIKATQTDTLQQKQENIKTESQVKEKTPSQSILSYFSLSKIVLSLIIIVISYIFIRILSKILGIWAERNVKRRVTIKGFIPVIRITIWILVIYFLITAVFKPPMATILAFAASIGVAIGFASQDLLKNIFGGITIILDKPFKIGDKVQIGQYYGEITEIGLRSTRMVTADDSMVSVPNSEVMNQSVANANSGEENCQVVTEFFLPVNADTEKIKQTALEAAQVSRYIYLNKPIVILFSQEPVGYKIVLKMKIKAYVNDIRDEFKFKSDLTEILSKELLMNQNYNLGADLDKF